MGTDTKNDTTQRSEGWADKVSVFAERLLLYTDSPEELLEAMSVVVSGPRPDPSLLTDTDIGLLETIGVGTPNRDSAQYATLATAFSELVAASLTVEQLAAAVNVTPSRIRQRLNHDRTLWGFKVGPRYQWRIPAWEIVDGQLLPGVEPVARAIPDGMHPVAVDRLVRTPNPDLIIDNEAVSVRDWLAAGGDPATAAASVGDPADLT